jgi:hypothetical protein
VLLLVLADVVQPQTDGRHARSAAKYALAAHLATRACDAD